MKKLMIAGAMLGIAALVSGCGGTTKEEVLKKSHVLLVRHAGGNLCNGFVVSQIAAKKGYSDVKFALIDDTTCADLGRTENTCEETTYNGDGADPSKACLTGTDQGGSSSGNSN